MGSNSEVYLFDEVAKHNHKKDCWIIISGKIKIVHWCCSTLAGSKEGVIKIRTLASNSEYTDLHTLFNLVPSYKVLLFVVILIIQKINRDFSEFFHLVYDVTPFLEEHPGGDEVLLLAVEKDATDDFNDVGHSDSAREQMEKYYVGKVDTSTIPAQPNYKLPPQAAAPAEQSSGLVTSSDSRKFKTSQKSFLTGNPYEEKFLCGTGARPCGCGTIACGYAD
ncbi:hypothetical protein DVH24_005434 [Malus domestica]|uniref:Cytochrome b5 heme-binding domain-containing protein n=1 Tax=Malus domestica TaxID=3750 RepID=A0A498KKF9_MALDO|nr:hypothetical protein DVH24_005434 [Malus domestica]